MAVTNGWGQGVINNTNGWGKLATNNIGAGSVYENSASGDTALIGTSAAFSYSASSFTQADADPTPTITGTTGGTFSGTSGLVFVSTSTGEIDLSASTIAAHVVTYTVGGVSSNFNLSVLAAPFSNTFSYNFDGVDDFIDVGNPTELQITGALSISAWVKFTGNTAPIVSKYESGSASRPKSFGLEGDRSGSNHSPKFFIFNSGTIYETPASVKVVDDGNWHHLLGVFNPSTYLRLYIDGNLEQENTTSIPATIDNDAADFVIGAIKSVGNPITFFSGNIDEVAVWNSDQSSNVASIYNSGVPNDITSLNPVAWYRMGEQATWDGSKWTLIDQGTGSNNAESVNMTESDRQTDVPT